MAIDTQPTEPFPPSANPSFAASATPSVAAAPPAQAESFGLTRPPEALRPVQEERSRARTPLIVGAVVRTALLLIAAAMFALR